MVCVNQKGMIRINFRQIGHIAFFKPQPWLTFIVQILCYSALGFSKYCSLSINKYNTTKLAMVNSIDHAIMLFAFAKELSKNEKYNAKRPKMIPAMGIIAIGIYFAALSGDVVPIIASIAKIAAKVIEETVIQAVDKLPINPGGLLKEIFELI